MPITDLLLEGVKLMLMGMGIVFSFLIILVFVMQGMSRLAMVLAGNPTELENNLSVKTSIPHRDEPGAELISVISAAVARHRAGDG